MYYAAVAAAVSDPADPASEPITLEELDKQLGTLSLQAARDSSGLDRALLTCRRTALTRDSHSRHPRLSCARPEVHDPRHST